MKTVMLNVQDNFLNRFYEFCDLHKNEISLFQDPQLESDPYFYERRRDLQQLRSDTKNGQMELLSQDQYEEEINHFFETLQR